MNTLMLLAAEGEDLTMGMSRPVFGLVIFLLGMLVIFLGICILIGCINLVKLFMGIGGEKSPKKKVAPAPVVVAPAPVQKSVPATNGVSPEVVAVITAAIAATYDQEQQVKTEFVVRRNKKFKK